MPTPQQLLGQAEAKLKSGDLPGGARLLADFLKQCPTDPRAAHVRAHLGEVQLARGLHDEAERLFEQARKDLGDNPQLLFRLAQIAAMRGRTDDAFGLLDRVLELEPSHAGAIGRRAALLQHTGRDEEAAAMIDEAHARGLRDAHLASIFAGVATKLGRRREAIERLEPYAGDRSLPRQVLAGVNFTLGRMFDAESEYDRAWACYEKGNTLMRPRLDIAQFDRATDETIRTFTREAVASLERAPDSGERAVLIVGMPRSGTTLLDQVLAAHGQIASGGELSALPRAVETIPGNRGPAALPPLNRVRGTALKRASQSYLEALNAVDVQAARVVDKLPINYRLLGLVPSMLPGAHVIHCTRDPIDTCVSCYFRNFTGGNVIFTDLTWIGRIYLNYARLMRHWRDVLEGQLELLDVSYTDVVHQLEDSARRMVSFVGLDFDESCLHFDQRRRVVPTLEPEQVGRTVYDTSVGRWKHYEKHLGPLLSVLGPELKRHAEGGGPA